MNQPENLDKAKQEVLKEIVLDLHKGKDLPEVKKKFARLIKDVSPEEISAMENALIEEGFPPEQIQQLCNVHVEVFQTALKRTGKPKKVPGHPVHTYMMENREVKKRIKTLKSLAKKAPSQGEALEKALREGLEDVKQYDIHFQRKENQLFPVLEAGGFEGPSKVMWGKHDEIRDLFREFSLALDNKDWLKVKSLGKNINSSIKKMVFMEERILYPTALKKINDNQWARIRNAESHLGYAWIKPGNLWDSHLVSPPTVNFQSPAPEPGKGEEAESPPPAEAKTLLKLSIGELTLEQLDLMLRNLPVDVTFVDEEDKVRYFSHGRERIFPRSPEIIGRDVRNCHPPKSLHVVTNILESFKKKEKDVAEFWITLGGKFIHIRYFPVYDEKGDYRGVLEVSQDVTGIRALEGERRLLDW